MMKHISECTLVFFYFVTQMLVSNGHYIYSPNYPGDYAPYTDCNYTITTVNSWGKVNLTLYEFYFKYYTDYLDIYESGHQFVRKLQGRIGYQTFILNYPVVLQFHSGPHTGSRGFKSFYGATTGLYGVNPNCVRSCTGNYGQYYERECGLRTEINCYNYCNKKWILFNGESCPNYFRFVKSSKSFSSGGYLTDCFSLCQNRPYTTESNCSNDNADIPPYQNCFDTCRQQYVTVKGQCPNYLRNNNYQCVKSLADHSVFGYLAAIVVFCAIVMAGTIAMTKRRQHVPKESTLLTSDRLGEINFNYSGLHDFPVPIITSTEEDDVPLLRIDEPDDDQFTNVSVLTPTATTNEHLKENADS